MLDTNDMHRYNGKRVVVTGGTTGIGLATAKLFRDEGAAVLVTGRSRDTLEQARAELPEDVVVLRSDATNLTDIRDLANEVRARWDRFDVLFVNAGTAKVTPLEAIDEAVFDEVVAVNLKGALFTIQSLRPLLRSGGSIVINTSVASHWQLPATSLYAATKAALGAIVRTLAAELAPQRIRVNAVCPGLIETPMFGKLGLPPDALSALAAQLVGLTQLGRTGTPDEIARAVLFLASDDASYVVGEELVVDGGMMMR